MQLPRLISLDAGPRGSSNDRRISKEDRRLILQAQLRPAAVGIVKDERAPCSLAQALTRSGGPQGTQDAAYARCR